MSKRPPGLGPVVVWLRRRFWYGVRIVRNYGTPDMTDPDIRSSGHPYDSHFVPKPSFFS